MKKKQWRSSLFLLVILILTFNISENTTQKIRSLAAGSIIPTWGVFQIFLSRFSSSSLDSKFQEMENLRRENALLVSQIENIRQWLLNEDRIEEQVIRLKETSLAGNEEETRAFMARRREQIGAVLKLQLKAIPAKVVYREPCFWSSFLWVNVGEQDNRAVSSTVIGKNSPVVVGNTLIGVIEEVQERKSKVRLITDSRLVIGVRTIRGSSQDRLLVQQIESLFSSLESRRDLFSSDREASQFFAFLQRFLSQENAFQDLYLAKGELFGSSFPLWRSRGQLLKGSGFNYDFADEEGSAKDLRGQLSLLKAGDLLVTSGLDGVFPPGLEVATVYRVETLREGATSYDIEAKALAENLDELGSVFVLPPL